MRKAGIISLGCARNLVDSEIMVGSLKERGFEVVEIEDGVDVGIVNTCGFIDSAKEESMDVILSAAGLKEEGKIRHLVVCGCLAQLYKKDLLRKIPEIDLVVGTADFAKIPDLLDGLAKSRAAVVSKSPGGAYNERATRSLLTPLHYAYVKITEGCSNLCSYCIISKLRGRLRSRPIESIIREIERLSSDGRLKEINLIGQDTTLYGLDLYGKKMLPALLRKICRLQNKVSWVRLLYTHPAHYSDELISLMRDEVRIVKYLDLPVQHISDKILKRMNRQTTKRSIINLIEKLRKNIPGLTLRTSVIVGFPGETDRDFNELLRFVREMKFERLGAFIYSKEAGTKAAKFKGQIPEKVKAARFDEVMRLQQTIAAGINQSFFGRTVDVLIDEKAAGENGTFLGRTEGDAPEVDGTVHVSGTGLKIGELQKVKITDTLEYDLVGVAV